MSDFFEILFLLSPYYGFSQFVFLRSSFFYCFIVLSIILMTKDHDTKDSRLIYQMRIFLHQTHYVSAIQNRWNIHRLIYIKSFSRYILICVCSLLFIWFPLIVYAFPSVLFCNLDLFPFIDWGLLNIGILLVSLCIISV